jgi:hypothetical protein
MGPKTRAHVGAKKFFHSSVSSSAEIVLDVIEAFLTFLYYGKGQYSFQTEMTNTIVGIIIIVHGSILYVTVGPKC